MKKQIVYILVALAFSACRNNDVKPDGYGHFEANERYISSEVSGKLIAVYIEEGDHRFCIEPIKCPYCGWNLGNSKVEKAPRHLALPDKKGNEP